MNSIDKTIQVAKEKQSGMLWIAIAILLLILIVPLIIFGVFVMLKNMTKTIANTPNRRLSRTERKRNKLKLKQEIKQLKNE